VRVGCGVVKHCWPTSVLTLLISYCQLALQLRSSHTVTATVTLSQLQSHCHSYSHTVTATLSQLHCHSYSHTVTATVTLSQLQSHCHSYINSGLNNGHRKCENCTEVVLSFAVIHSYTKTSSPMQELVVFSIGSI